MCLGVKGFVLVLLVVYFLELRGTPGTVPLTEFCASQDYMLQLWLVSGDCQMCVCPFTDAFGTKRSLLNMGRDTTD